MRYFKLSLLTSVTLGLFAVAGDVQPNYSFSVVSSAHAALNQPDQIEDAKNFINRVAENGIGFLENKEITQERRIARFRELLRNSFDMKTIGRFALGRYWRTATDAQKKEYLDLFQTMVVDVYSRRFNDYEGQNVEIKDARADGKADVIVTSVIVSEDTPEVQVDWRVRFKKDHYKIVDVIVEGVSMALTQRSDFSSVIQRGGGKIDVLLDHLRQ